MSQATPPSALDFMQQLVDANVHETGGKNRGPEIDAINREMGLPLGSPYCAATVSHCFREVQKATPMSTVKPARKFAYSGSSQAIRRAFEGMAWRSWDPQDLLKWRGALGGWTDEGDPAHGHIFFIKGRLVDKDGQVIGVSTLEANTSPHTQGRDGEGVFQLRRIFDGQRHKLWFLDTSEILGGAWWPETR